MFKFVVLYALVACALGAAIPDGLLPQLDGRIVGGDEADFRNHPYQVSLQRDGSHACGGSVFSFYVIVTAAHCLQNVDASSLKVRAGSASRSGGGSLVAVASYQNNLNFNANTMVYDVAVVRLSSDLPLGSTIKTINMATIAPDTGTYAFVSGWGTTSYKGPSYDTLRYAQVRIISKEECSSDKYYYGNAIKNTMICAAASGKDACQGDSGGPLVAGSDLVGIVSWGSGCAESKYPGVYTNVAVVRLWINANA